MYKNKNEDGTLNISGKKIGELRIKMSSAMSQKVLADRMQECGIELDKNAIQRIECGKRFITDIELKAFAKFFGITADELLNGK